MGVERKRWVKAEKDETEKNRVTEHVCVYVFVYVCVHTL